MSACSLQRPVTLAPEQDAPFRPRYLALWPSLGTDHASTPGQGGVILRSKEIEDEVREFWNFEFPALPGFA